MSDAQPSNQKSETKMTSGGGTLCLWSFGLGLLVLAALVASIPYEPVEVPSANAAGILTLVAAGAVGIERIMESFWTIIGSRLGNWWPLKPIGERLDAFVTRLNVPLKSFQEQAQQELDSVGGVTGAATEQLKKGREYLDKLDDRAKALAELDPGSPDAQKLAAEASQAVVGLKKLYPRLENSASAANRALAGVNEFVQTFADNPARRLMSIYAGAVLGLLFAWALGLDAIQATLGDKTFPAWAPQLGVAATGLVIGLGAAPTHELVKTLQEVKTSRKREDQNKPGEDQNKLDL